uniref:Cytochrome c oxidase-assembly factor COX23-like n=1 Tax=Rhizophora mucronata TaxID=61149 RepID=A0A2P2IQM3_RHIMU
MKIRTDSCCVPAELPSPSSCIPCKHQNVPDIYFCQGQTLPGLRISPSEFRLWQNIFHEEKSLIMERGMAELKN